MRHTLPVDYPSGDCIVVAIDRLLVPIIIGQLLLLLEPRSWDQESYQAGYRAVTEVLAQMTNNCFTAFVQELRDFRGVKPDFVSVPVDERTSDMYNSLNDLFAQMLDARGIIEDGWFSDRSTTLLDVVQAQRGTIKETGVGIFDDVKALLDGGSDIATVIDTISNFLTNEEQTVIEGGLLLSLVAITSANSQIMASQGLQFLAIQNGIDAIVQALRGGTAPTDNILLALRGTTDASDTRNVITELE
jgi:hypothetical protein